MTAGRQHNVGFEFFFYLSAFCSFEVYMHVARDTYIHVPPGIPGVTGIPGVPDVP